MRNKLIITAADAKDVLDSIAAEKRDPRAREAKDAAERKALLANRPGVKPADPLPEIPQDVYTAVICLIHDTNMGTRGNPLWERVMTPTHIEGFPARVVTWSGAVATEECGKLNQWIADNHINVDRDIEVEGRYYAIIIDGPAGVRRVVL